MPQCCDVARFFGTYVGGDDEIEKVHTDCWRQLVDELVQLWAERLVKIGPRVRPA
jgi:hypothetical protein